MPPPCGHQLLIEGVYGAADSFQREDPGEGLRVDVAEDAWRRQGLTAEANLNCRNNPFKEAC